MRSALLLTLCLAAAAPLRAAEPVLPADPAAHAALYAGLIAETTAHCTVRSRVGPADTPLPLALSNFLLDHPDLSAYLVRVRRIAPYRIEMRSPRQSWADDGDGTAGLITLVERTDTRRLYYGEGAHRSRLFPVIRASAVIEMDLAKTTGADGRPHTRTVFTVWVRIHNRFVSRLVRILKPFLRRTVIGKFSKAFMVADKVGRLMAKDPAGVAADARGFTELSAAGRADLEARMARLSAPRSVDAGH
jgi:hypothetical protein